MKKLIQLALIIVTILLVAAITEIDNLHQDVSNAGDGWYQTMGALKLALERIDTLEQELANEELFSKYVRRELAEEQRRIPVCQEDATLIGVGDFTSTPDISGGTWDAYHCYFSADDFLPPR